MSTIKATPAFMRDAKKLLSQEALNDLTDSLVLAPKQGVIIQGTGGVRKMRWQTGKDGKGKRGGVRVLYYFDGTQLILLLMLYKKSEKANISTSEKNILRKLLPELLERYKDE
ncbi:MAG: type II toxin-antitoxin system RelE/ParE family toxin [Legionellales bacterium]|jgi:hypothetical protein